MKITIDNITFLIVGGIIGTVLTVLGRGLYDGWKNRKSKQFRELYVKLVAAIDTLDSIPPVDPYNPDGLENYKRVYREHVSVTVAKLEQLGIPLPPAFRIDLTTPGYLLTGIMCVEFLRDIAELSNKGKFRQAKKLPIQTPESRY